MDYRAITDKSSKQYKLISSGIFNKDNGLLITNDGYVAVALASRFGNIGDKFIVTLDNGASFKAIKTDEKSDSHTVNKCHHKNDGSLVEFVVDTNKLKTNNNLAYVMGDISYVDGFKGGITSVVKEVEISE
jgi:hypothetical protein